MTDQTTIPATSGAFVGDLQLPLTVQVKNLNHFFGEGELRKQALFDNYLEVRRGEIVIMTGPSGSGKTTLLTLIGTLRTAQEGSLKVLGKQLQGCDRDLIVNVRRELGFIFQAHNLFESLTAYQNVNMAAELAGLDPMIAEGRIKSLLTRLGLGDRIHYKPKSLSGGQKQSESPSHGDWSTNPNSSWPTNRLPHSTKNQDEKSSPFSKSSPATRAARSSWSPTTIAFSTLPIAS